ncbi:hypothetical protein [Fructobacillus papyrifericola]|uniref:Uncharacterized protein n=1 Tax=Fructobacillus papyrifericola TaxID=2713172 RepID=A0ABS5QWC9_9LACO|nr:hypothetical protein [Fructobacillus papyrifericola]MBS9336676.1 hypothetical protein [Fructobacillus papyrifericola]
MKEFIEKHIIWFLAAIIILEALNIFSPLGKDATTSIILNLALLVYSAFLLVGVRSNHNKKK